MVSSVRSLALFLALGYCANFAFASELSDNMRLFFEGDYKTSHAGLSALIQQGNADCRAYYFRGLASNRLGDTRSAAADFQKGAVLELTGKSQQAVGLALQRVQGSERLLLEKHRTMARLAARNRMQPVAPKPVVPMPSGAPVQPAAEKVSSGVPVFRLASEIPLRSPLVSPDPFVDESVVAAAQMPEGPSIVQQSSHEDEPVGTGVAETADEFAMFEESTPAEPVVTVTDRTPVQNRSAGAKKGVLGSVFRALTRAAVPKVPTSMMPSGLLPGPKLNANAVPAFDPSDDPFGETTPTDEESDPFGDL